MIVNGTDVTVKGIDNISEQEILAYLDFIHRDNQREIGHRGTVRAGGLRTGRNRIAVSGVYPTAEKDER